MWVEVEVEQRVHLGIDDQNDAAAAAAVTAVRSAEGFELLAMNRGAAVTAVACPRVNHDAIDEPGHGRTPSKVTPGRKSVREAAVALQSRSLGLWSRGADDADGLASPLGAEFDG